MLIQRTLFDRPDKDLVLEEHLESLGLPIGAKAECRIRKIPGSGGLRHYFVYWADGLIQRRDTYFVYPTDSIPAYLAYSEKRYSSRDKWIEET